MTESEVLAQFSWEHDLLGNVTQQLETWPGDFNRSAGVRSTSMTYDADNRLATETVVEPTAVATTTAYAYDAANNRLQKTVTGGSDPGVWHYTYNEANQLTHWEQWDTENGTMLKNAALTYDDDGNRTAQNVSITGGDTGNGINPPPAASGTTSYQWDAQDRLSSVTLPDGTQHAYDYDYRTRRIGTHKLASGVQQAQTAIVFAGGLSLAEFDTTTDTLPDTPTVEYVRGPDMGGGVGGMLYSMRASGTKYSLSNGRGDIVAQADSSATLTWTASYEAYGRRTTETGLNQDKQRGNSKDEDPTGLLNEGFRYRDLETGVWLSRDPAGFVDGPNVYAYVKQNPWTGFDAHGLFVMALPAVPVICEALVWVGTGVASFCAGWGIAEVTKDKGQSATRTPGPTEHITTATPGHKAEPSIEAAPPKPDALPGADTNAAPKPHSLPGKDTSAPSPKPTELSTPDQSSLKIKGQNELQNSNAGTYVESNAPVLQRPLPKNKYGVLQPDTNVPHTQLGRSTPSHGSEPQAREWMWDSRGNLVPVRDIDFSDHNMPTIHPKPHQHELTPANPAKPLEGGFHRGKPEPLK